MERLVSDDQIKMAIRQATCNKVDRENMLADPRTKNFRRPFLSEYVASLADTITLLKAVQNPSDFSSEELIRIIVESPKVTAAVGEFASGKILGYHELIENVMMTSFQKIFPWIFIQPPTPETATPS